MSITKKDIIPLILTYGNRSAFVRTTLKNLEEQGIFRAVVVVNRARTEDDVYPSFATVIFVGENSGSAAGFGCGLRYLWKQYRDKFVLMLDDDNIPEPGAVAKLLVHLNFFADKKKPFALVGFRTDRGLYRRLYKTGDPSEIFSPSNKFRSFDFFKLFRRSRVNSASFAPIASPVPLRIAPYGGLVFPVAQIARYGLPDPQYYFYCDDYEYTKRMTDGGAEIYFCPDVRISDQESSWNMRGNVLFALLNLKPAVLYYAIRNTAYFDRKNRVYSSLQFYLNMLVYSVVLTMAGVVMLRFSRLRAYYVALFHSLVGKLGINCSYRLL